MAADPDVAVNWLKAHQSACHPEAQPKDLQLLFVALMVLFQRTMSDMHQGCYFTYIMASRSRMLYSGVTGDLRKRAFEHKWKEHAGFTARYNCDRLVWFERHQYVQDAIAREKHLKGWRRARKIELIESLNSAWTDLSRDWYDYEPADYSRALDRMNS